MKKILVLFLLVGFGFSTNAQKFRLPKVKTYQTYVKQHPSGTKYAGHTSGYSTPASNVKKRDNSHHMNDKGYKPAQLDKTHSTKMEARTREQQLVKKFGGATRSGGTSGNTINAVRIPGNKVKL
jgi:hypothetical protein